MLAKELDKTLWLTSSDLLLFSQTRCSSLLTIPEWHQQWIVVGMTMTFSTTEVSAYVRKFEQTLHHAS